MVTAGKLLLYLTEVVEKEGNRKRKRVLQEDGTEVSVPLGYEAYQAAAKAVIAL